MSLIILGHWQLTMYVRVRSVDHPADPHHSGDPTPAEGIARRALRHQAVEADQARWWADAYLTARHQSLR
jgi:hypothetical protein